MKKYVKLAAVLVLAAVLCLTFCSCDELDEMRDSHAFWANEEKTAVTFRGNEYKLLPACDDLYIIPGYEYGYITESDVPVLLSDSFGDQMQVSKNAEMLVSGNWEDNYECNRVYCRADLYDAKVKAIEEYELNWFCVYESEYTYSEGDSAYRFLTEQSVDIILAAFEGEGRESEANPYFGEDIFICDDSLQFISESTQFWVVRSTGTYSVAVRKAVNEGYSTTFIYYDIPKEDGDILWCDITGNNDAQHY